MSQVSYIGRSDKCDKEEKEKKKVRMKRYEENKLPKMEREIWYKIIRSSMCGSER